MIKLIEYLVFLEGATIGRANEWEINESACNLF